MPSILELEQRQRTLQSKANELAKAIGTHEQRIDTALEELAEAFPDQDFSDPAAIDFDGMTERLEKVGEDLEVKIDKSLTYVEALVEEANAELRNIVE